MDRLIQAPEISSNRDVALSLQIDEQAAINEQLSTSLAACQNKGQQAEKLP